MNNITKKKIINDFKTFSSQDIDSLYSFYKVNSIPDLIPIFIKST